MLEWRDLIEFPTFGKGGCAHIQRDGTWTCEEQHMPTASWVMGSGKSRLVLWVYYFMESSVVLNGTSPWCVACCGSRLGLKGRNFLRGGGRGPRLVLYQENA